MAVSGVSNDIVTSAGNVASKQLTGNFDTFIKMLTTQLQNQDPLAPMETSEFTNQLVMYSQVEQQIGTNDKLTALLNITAGNTVNTYVNFIGKDVDVQTDQLYLENNKARVGYMLPENAASVDVQVMDKSGAILATIPGGKTLGRNSVEWNGVQDNGQTAPAGSYKFKVVAKNAEGGIINSVTPYFTGLVKGVESGSKGVDLNFGKGFSVTPDAVMAVRNTNTI